MKSRGMARYNVALTKLWSNRTVGFGQSESDILRGEGYETDDEFWGELVSRTHGADRFVEMLYTFQRTPLQNPPDEDDQDKLLLLQAAMRDALKADHEWIRRRRNAPPGDDRLVNWVVDDPAAATLWLLARPKYRDLVPPGLKAYVQSRASAPEKNKGGRPFDKKKWFRFAREIIRIANSIDGLPERPALVAHMRQWCTDHLHQEPADSDFRDAIGALLPDPE